MTADKNLRMAEGLVLADVYESLKHEPGNPEILDSYKVLLEAMYEQWEYFVGSGMIQVDYTEEPEVNPNSKEILKRLIGEHKLTVLAEESSPSGLLPGHPMADMAPIGGVQNNLIFRAVHDIVGHGMTKSSFSDAGERQAYLNHANTIPREALKALTVETRMQNCWTNWHAGHQNLAPHDRPFPKQKVGNYDFVLVPDTLVTEIDPLPIGKSIDIARQMIFG